MERYVCAMTPKATLIKIGKGGMYHITLSAPPGIPRDGSSGCVVDGRCHSKPRRPKYPATSSMRALRRSIPANGTEGRMILLKPAPAGFLFGHHD